MVDVQEKLAPHVQGHERLIARAGALVRAAKLLAVPVLASEHCQDRIGRTVPALRSLARRRGCDYEPFLVDDTVGSQRAEDRAAGLQRMSAAGCSSATAEMAIIEWLHRADDARFREVLQIVKGL